MYNSISAYVNSYEIVFFYPCNYGTETIEGLYSWESKDPANRRLIKVDNRESADTIVSNRKLLKTFAA